MVNGDELFAKNVELTSTSWGLVNEQNIVRTNVNKKNGITTTPFVSAAGDVLPTQVIAKGTTQRTIDNRQLSSDMAVDCSANGWQTEATFLRYINNYLIPYLGPEGGALVVDTYAAHLTDDVRICCNLAHIDIIVVPPHMTHAFPPLDIGVNALVRKYAPQQYVDEMHENKENVDPYGAAARRIHNALTMIDKRHIKQSFVDAVEYVPDA